MTAQRAAKDFTPSEALTRGQWYVLWAILTLNVTAGIAIISQAKPLAQSVGASVAVATGFALFAPLACIIALCYGGGFGTMPTFAADYFGPKRSGAIYGTMLTAWSAGGVLGPLLIAQVVDLTGGYGPAFTIIAVIMLVSIALPLFVRPPKAVSEAAPSEQAQPSPA
ncbi:MAG TPA: MFS transporter [Ktedonobacterales bacterium]